VCASCDHRKSISHCSDEHLQTRDPFKVHLCIEYNTSHPSGPPSSVVFVVSHRDPRQVFQSPILSHIGSGQAFTVKEVNLSASDWYTRWFSPRTLPPQGVDRVARGTNPVPLSARLACTSTGLPSIVQQADSPYRVHRGFVCVPAYAFHSRGIPACAWPGQERRIVLQCYDVFLDLDGNGSRLSRGGLADKPSLREVNDWTNPTRK